MDFDSTDDVEGINGTGGLLLLKLDGLREARWPFGYRLKPVGVVILRAAGAPAAAQPALPVSIADIVGTSTAGPLTRIDSLSSESKPQSDGVCSSRACRPSVFAPRLSLGDGRRLAAGPLDGQGIDRAALVDHAFIGPDRRRLDRLDLLRVNYDAPGCPDRHKSQGRHQQVSFHDLPFAQNYQGHQFSRAQYQTTPAPSNVNSPFWPEPFLAIRPGFCHCYKAAGPSAVTRALRTKVDRWNRIGLLNFA